MAQEGSSQDRQDPVPKPVVDDGTIRIGESSDVVRQAQRTLNKDGFRGADGQLLQEDGVYRLSMQPAVINYQQAHGLPQTGTSIRRRCSRSHRASSTRNSTAGKKARSRAT